MSDGFAMPPPRKPVAGDKKKGKKKKKLALFEAPPWYVFVRAASACCDLYSADWPCSVVQVHGPCRRSSTSSDRSRVC